MGAAGAGAPTRRATVSMPVEDPVDTFLGARNAAPRIKTVADHPLGEGTIAASVSAAAPSAVRLGAGRPLPPRRPPGGAPAEGVAPEFVGRGVGPAVRRAAGGDQAGRPEGVQEDALGALVRAGRADAGAGAPGATVAAPVGEEATVGPFAAAAGAPAGRPTGSRRAAGAVEAGEARVRKAAIGDRGG